MNEAIASKYAPDFYGVDSNSNVGSEREVVGCEATRDLQLAPRHGRRRRRCRRGHTGVVVAGLQVDDDGQVAVEKPTVLVVGGDSKHV